MGALIEYRGSSSAVRQYANDIWLTILWGVPEASDIDGLIRAWERAIEIGLSHSHLIDVTRVTRADPAAFGALATHLAARREAYVCMQSRRGILRSDGVTGAVAAGIVEVAKWPSQPRFFTDEESALAWLAPEDPTLPSAYVDWTRALADRPETVRRLREALLQDLVGAEVGGVARRLGMSSRTLQRQLRDLGTSFSAELEQARLERAKELLASTEHKIYAVMRAVGVQSEHRFSKRFAELTGLAPAAFRARHR